MLNANGKAFIGSLKENERVKKVFNYIEQHFKDPISLDDVAELIHMNPSSFSRFFKKTTNKTFISYLNEYRLNHAIQLLMETELDIKNIGYECGFTNLSNFFRHFKAHTQTTPYDYRRKFSKV
jgi:AraC-like DNA-binding protein